MVEQLDLGGDGDLILRGAALLVEGDGEDAEAVDRAAQDGVGLVRAADQLEATAGDHLIRDGLRDQLLEADASGPIDERRYFDGADLRVEGVVMTDESVSARGEKRERGKSEGSFHPGSVSDLARPSASCRRWRQQTIDR